MLFFTMQWFPLNAIIGIAIIGIIIWIIMANSGKKSGDNGGTSPPPPSTSPPPTGTLMTGTNLCFKSDNKSTYWTEQKAPRWQATCTSDNKAYMQLYLASDKGMCSDVSTLTSHPLKDGEIYRMCHIGDGYTKCLFDAAYEDWKDGSADECDTTTTDHLQAHWLLYKDGNKGDIVDGDTIWLQTLKESSKDCLGDGAWGGANMHEDFCWTDIDEGYKGKLIITNA